MRKRIVSSFQMTEADARKFDELEAAGFGTRTDIIRVALDRMYREELPSMNIRKPDNIHVEFKSLDWQNAVTTMEPKEAMRLLAKEVETLINDNCPGETAQHKSRQAELVHNAFVTRAAVDYGKPAYRNLWYRNIAHEMYSFSPIHEQVDYDH